MRRKKEEKTLDKIREKWLTVVLLRQLPAPAMFLNVCISRICPVFTSYCIGTILGILPLGILVVAAGAGFTTSETTYLWKLIILPLFGILWLFILHFNKIST
ncbi:MAG: hypothetical protein U9O87_07025 [Verrucomicrobiota bacterium]|nr:hypothetical protein [Verrucomicrobiota bacterium]